MSKKILGITQNRRIFIISAPAGTGKSTLVNMLVERNPDDIAESCSCTTRLPRPGEVHAHHYVYLSESEFIKKINDKEFLEYAKLFGSYYGTRKEEVFNLLNRRKHVILVIDTQGAMQIKQQNFHPLPVFIFIKPPSLEELRKRLIKRGTESEEKVQERLLWAERELMVANRYDYQVVNEDIELSYQVLQSIFIAEEHKQIT